MLFCSCLFAPCPLLFLLRHCDNPDKNGRILTAILYLNPDWSEGDGGELQLTQTRINGLDVTQEEQQRLVVIPPLMNRLLLFWSDRRCPHEVLPTSKLRYAMTTWYFNAQVFLALHSHRDRVCHLLHPSPPHFTTTHTFSFNHGPHFLGRSELKL